MPDLQLLRSICDHSKDMLGQAALAVVHVWEHVPLPECKLTGADCQFRNCASQRNV